MLFPEEAIVYTMDLIRLSGYSIIFLISSIVGTLSLAYRLPLGRPRLILFQGNEISNCSQNNLMGLM